jgi:hypothetical protein
VQSGLVVHYEPNPDEDDSDLQEPRADIIFPSTDDGSLEIDGTVRLQSFNKKPGLRTVSGFKLRTLSGIINIFEEVVLLSASLTDSHIDYIKAVSDKIEFTENTINNPDMKPDRGGVCFIDNRIGKRVFNLLLDDNFDFVHYETSKRSHDQLVEKLNRDSDLKNTYVSFRAGYRNDVQTKSTSGFPTRNETKHFKISYIGSNVSYGINLDEIDVLTLNMPHWIPFTFIPIGFTGSEDDIKQFITQSTYDRIIQAACRIPRFKGGNYKLILLGNCRCEPNNDDLIREFTSYPGFKDKFNTFDWFSGVVADIGYDMRFFYDFLDTHYNAEEPKRSSLTGTVLDATKDA